MRISDWSSDVCSSDLPLMLTASQRAGPKITIAVGVVILAVLMSLPLLSLLAVDNPLHVSAYTLTLVGKILCYAIVALALDLVWGYAGLLSLGHGLFFALGGYAMGMYLMRQAAGDGLPAFMRSEEHTSELQSLMRISYAVFCLK